MNTGHMYIGVDIGASKTLVAARDQDSDFKVLAKFATPADFDSFPDELKTHLDEVTQTPDKVVVAAPGTIKAGRLQAGGKINWQQADIVAALEQQFGAECDYHVLNDALAAGLYEARHGSGKNHNVVLYITVSTGIGTGIIINQQITAGFTTSEGGQIIIDHKDLTSFEDLASGSAFLERYGHEGKNEKNPEIWEEYGRLLGTGIFSMVALLQPSVVVIGGSMGLYFDAYGQGLTDTVDELSGKLFESPPILAAKKPESAVVRGCLEYADGDNDE